MTTRNALAGGCLIHYGMPKTGSSAIQTWLLTGLDDPRFHYLNLGVYGSGSLMVAALMREPSAHHRNRNRKRGVSADMVQHESAGIRARLLDQLKGLQGRTAIFSSELLAGIDATDLHGILALLESTCGDLRACGFVRSPASFMESVFQQRLKSGNATFNPRALYPGYRARLEKFDLALGRERVTHWPYDPAGFPRGCVVRDFCQRTGLPIAEANVPRVNDSLSLPAIRLLFAYRRFGPGYGAGEDAFRENRALKNRLLGLGGPKLRFHADIVAPVLARNRDDIRWMEQRLGVPLQESLALGPCDQTRSCSGSRPPNSTGSPSNWRRH